MSNIDPAFATEFSQATCEYDDLRYKAVVNGVGEAALTAIVDGVTAPQEVLRMTSEDLDQLDARQVSSVQLADEEHAFDQGASEIFGTVDGYKLSYIKPGQLGLWKEADGGKTFTIDITDTPNGLVVNKQMTPQHDWRRQGEQLPVAAQDMATLKKAVEQLRLTTSFLASS